MYLLLNFYPIEGEALQYNAVLLEEMRNESRTISSESLLQKLGEDLQKLPIAKTISSLMFKDKKRKNMNSHLREDVIDFKRAEREYDKMN